MPWEFEADLRGSADREHANWALGAYVIYFTMWGGLF